jgi:hypothetical protein
MVHRRKGNDSQGYKERSWDKNEAYSGYTGGLSKKDRRAREREPAWRPDKRAGLRFGYGEFRSPRKVGSHVASSPASPPCEEHGDDTDSAVLDEPEDLEPIETPTVYRDSVYHQADVAEIPIPNFFTGDESHHATLFGPPGSEDQWNPDVFDIDPNGNVHYVYKTTSVSLFMSSVNSVIHP